MVGQVDWITVDLIEITFKFMSAQEGNGMVPGLVAIAISAVFAAGVGFLVLRFIHL